MPWQEKVISKELEARGLVYEELAAYLSQRSRDVSPEGGVTLHQLEVLNAFFGITPESRKEIAAKLVNQDTGEAGVNPSRVRQLLIAGFRNLMDEMGYQPPTREGSRRGGPEKY